MEFAMHPPSPPSNVRESEEHDLGRSVEFYDKVAPHYDRGVSADFIQTHRELNRVIARQLSAEGPTRLLDLGGGTGRILTAFESLPNLCWFYCDASSKMRDVFQSRFGGSPVVAGVKCADAEEFLRSDTSVFDIILASFLLSSMPYLIDLNLLKRRLAKRGTIVVVEANPSYSESKPKFTIEDKVGHTFKYSLRIKPVDAPALATRAALVGLTIHELIGYDKGNQPYSYIATFQKQ
jgi:ubiquinone/menaquinone biosynthesis C-methylase UbiE